MSRNYGVFSQRILSRWLRVDFCTWRNRFENLSKNLRPKKRKTIYSRNIRYIFISDTALQKKTDIYSSFFRIKSLRACWIVLQRWAWGRQRGVASSLSLDPFSFPTSAPSRTNRLKIPERDFKQKRKKRKIDYPATQSIQKSARFSFRVVWFVHAPVTHPTLQPLLTVSIVFLFISIYFRFFLFAYFCCV